MQRFRLLHEKSRTSDEDPEMCVCVRQRKPHVPSFVSLLPSKVSGLLRRYEQRTGSRTIQRSIVCGVVLNRYGDAREPPTQVQGTPASKQGSAASSTLLDLPTASKDVRPVNLIRAINKTQTSQLQWEGRAAPHSPVDGAGPNANATGPCTPENMG
ncbi:hypothetical protein CORC01_02097 [Colletotrichum orchidophilum]|uniref:Uncharacterized protein n=1 Tax=Colletotrichum orchidophilum TaxID=1209926 RepID=A0A1G4BMN3_9PEZI|nr:uncharacterized protein CORC01_02097 [Colletotrichum orchidophilum]OHF02701.1 hypothetical protein CORC01_02097 [Colletotrichum orchidophilum]